MKDNTQQAGDAEKARKAAELAQLLYGLFDANPFNQNNDGIIQPAPRSWSNFGGGF